MECVKECDPQQQFDKLRAFCNNHSIRESVKPGRRDELWRRVSAFIERGSTTEQRKAQHIAPHLTPQQRTVVDCLVSMRARMLP